MNKKNLCNLWKEKKSFLSIFLFSFALFFVADKINAQEEYAPVLISSGFNQDIIAEDSPAEDYTTSPVDGTDSGANNAFMSEDFPGSTTGLPANGKINSETTEGLAFQLADYTENNSLRLVDSEEEGTLVLQDPTTANKIYVLATSGSGNAYFTGEVVFTDNSTQSIDEQYVPDWYNNSENVVIKGIGRVSLINDGVDNNNNDPRLYQVEITIDEENQDKEIEEISIVKNNADGFLNIMGLSKSFDPDCPQPTAITLEEATAETADISWSSQGDEDTWKVIYGEAGFNPENEGETIEDLTETNITLENLSQNTSYDLYVIAVCDSDEESNLGVAFNFTTSCDIVGVPYTQDFENITPPEIPACDTAENLGGGNGWTTSSNEYGIPDEFEGNFLFVNYGGFGENLNAWFFTQGIELEADTDYVISFKYGNNSTDYTEKLKVMFGNNPSEDNMEEEIVDLNDISDAQAHNAEHFFTVEEDGVYYFGFNAYSEGNQYYLFLDDIKVDIAPTCMSPSNLTLEEVEEETATLSWETQNEESEWEVLYGETGFDIESEGESITVEEDAEVSLTDLMQNTTYDIYVKSICGENEESEWSTPLTFTTSCGFAEVPFTQDFEEVTTPEIPSCGAIEVISGNAWETIETTLSGFNSTVLRYSYSSEEADSWYFTQGISMEAGVNYEISYKYGNSGSWAEKLKIAFGTSASSEDMEEELADHDNIVGTETNVENFTVPEDGVYYFGFNAHSDANQNILYLDDIEITFAPTCLQPTALTLVDTQTDSAEISWTPGNDETEWELKYGPTGFDVETEGETITAEDNPETIITDLDSGTTYDVYIKSICEDEEEESEWSESLTFTTPCVPTTVPFLQDFEEADAPEIPNCGTIENAGSGNNWITYDPDAPGNYSVPIGFEGNVLSYEAELNNPADAWYFTQGIELEAGVNYKISYKYGNGDASGAVEKMRVKMGTSASSDAMENELADHPEISEVSSETNTLIFTVEEDDVYYFGFHAYSDTNQYFLFLDDISIEYGPTCPAPTEITFDYITNNSAEVNWTSAEGNTTWEIIYGETGFDPETEGETLSAESNTGNIIENLEEDTAYDVYVKAFCEEEEGEISEVATFSTLITPPENTFLCNAIELTPNTNCEDGPYSNEDAFEMTNEPIGSCLNNFYGTNTVWFSFVATDTEAIITTDFSSTEFTTEIAAFEAPTDCEDASTLGEEVGCAANDEEATLTDLTIGDTYYVKVGGFNNAEGNFCIDVQMEEVEEETCPEPTSVVIDEIEEDTATVSWTPGEEETSWEVLYGLADFDIETEGESITVTDGNPQTVLTDLEAETEYDVYVRAICDNDLNSDWVGPETFTTQEMGVDQQIFQDFNFYPNPTQNVLTLKAGEQIEQVYIHNLLGQEVINITPNQLETQINLSNLQADVYLMKVIIDGNSKVFRVIKQ